MKVWEELVFSVGVVVVLIVGIFMSIFGVAGVSYAVTTGHTVQQSTTWSVLYGVVLLAGLGMVYLGMRQASAER